LFDVSAIGLSDLVRLSAALRVPPPVDTMEEVGQHVVRYLYDNLVDKGTGDRSCVLVRLFKTHPYQALEPAQQAFATSVLGTEPEPRSYCLTLLASAGVREEWNDRRRSVAHQAVPLGATDVIDRFPMLHGLLRRLGQATSGGTPLARNFDVFHVADAVGSPHVPDQDGFVLPYGVRSVIGFGGVLPDGETYVVVLFSKTPVMADTAEQFRTVAGSVGLALLPYTHRVFAGGPEVEPPVSLSEWRATALDQLLQVREVTVLEQSLRLEQALVALEDRASELARSRSVLVESEARKAAMLSASLDAIVTADADGRIVEFNPAAEHLFGYAAADAVGARLGELIIPPRLRAAHDAGVRRHLDTGEARILGQRVEIDALHADGTEFPVELTVSRIDLPGPVMFTAHIRDLTDTRRVESELRELADTLQAGLLPPRPPRIPGVEVATHYRAGGQGLRVGGDFYDVFHLGDDEWGLIIGDVCGKGARAASITSLVRHTARAAAVHSATPSDVMHEINAALAEGPDQDDRYCSAVFCRLRISPGRVDVQSCSGGHPSPLIARTSGDVEAVSTDGGQLIGLFEEYESSCEEYALHAGDVVVLYTDGVTEARDAAGDLFGSERLSAVVGRHAGASADEVVAAITRALDEWTDQLNDDIAIVALRPLAPDAR
jgi:sigma-B regulation protein RsbU (phosphoserine phosphatase)